MVAAATSVAVAPERADWVTCGAASLPHAGTPALSQATPLASITAPVQDAPPTPTGTTEEQLEPEDEESSRGPRALSTAAHPGARAGSFQPTGESTHTGDHLCASKKLHRWCEQVALMSCHVTKHW